MSDESRADSSGVNETGFSPDAACRALSSPQRVHLFAALDGNDGKLSIAALVDSLQQAATPVTNDRGETALRTEPYHQHLPVLKEVGGGDYDWNDQREELQASTAPMRSVLGYAQ